MNSKPKTSDFTPHHFPRKSGAGFTLVETVLAIAILSMAIVAPLTVASTSLSVATVGKDRLIAISLARDAVEYIRFVRDTNQLHKDYWLKGLHACTESQSCKIESYQVSGDPSITAGGSEKIGYDASTGRYGYSGGWPESKFTRTVKIETLQIDKEVRIISTVTWETVFSTKKVEVVDQITNWPVR